MFNVFILTVRSKEMNVSQFSSAAVLSLLDSWKSVRFTLPVGEAQPQWHNKLEAVLKLGIQLSVFPEMRGVCLL